MSDAFPFITAYRWTLMGSPPPSSPSSSGHSCPPRSSTCRQRWVGFEVGSALSAIGGLKSLWACTPVPACPLTRPGPRPPPTGVCHAGHVRRQVPLAQGPAQAAVEAQPGQRAAGADHRGPDARVQREGASPQAQADKGTPGCRVQLGIGLLTWQSCRATALSRPNRPPPSSPCRHRLTQVSPFHASVLMHFHTRPEWPAAELAERMGVAPDLLRRKVVFWINQGGQRRGRGEWGWGAERCGPAQLCRCEQEAGPCWKDGEGMAQGQPCEWHARPCAPICARAGPCPAISLPARPPSCRRAEREPCSRPGAAGVPPQRAAAVGAHAGRRPAGGHGAGGGRGRPGAPGVWGLKAGSSGEVESGSGRASALLELARQQVTVTGVSRGAA